MPGDPRKRIETDQFFMNRGFRDMLRKAYARYNIYWLGWVYDPGFQIISKVPINSVADLKGLKIRATGLLAPTFAKLGASPTFIPAEELYTSLAQGIVDAACWGGEMETVDMKLHEVAKHYIYPPQSGWLIFPYLVNLDTWNALPDDLKEIVETMVFHSKDNAAREIQIATDKSKKIMIDAGVNMITWSKSDVAKFMKAADEAAEEFAGDDAESLKFLDMYRQQLKDLGY